MNLLALVTTLLLAAMPSQTIVTGLDSPEDLALVNGGNTVLASSLNDGGLYIVDVKTKAASKIDLAAIPEAPRPEYPCASLKASGAFVSHGISVKRAADGRQRLYVVRHGGREAIEIFEFQHADDIAALHWIGCVTLPAGFAGNAVVGRRDGGFFTTSMFNSGSAPSSEKVAILYASKPSGAVMNWTPGTGYSTFPIGSISGPNGIELSSDEKQLYVAAWSSRAIWQFDTANPNANARHLDTAFMPDNLRWAPDGRLLAAGVHGTAAEVMGCAMKSAANVRCDTHWTAIAVDPITLRIVSEFSQNDASFGDVSVALQVGTDLWLGSFDGTSIAIEAKEPLGLGGRASVNRTVQRSRQR
jgi:sugar lactone lactonase YvrE